MLLGEFHRLGLARGDLGLALLDEGAHLARLVGVRFRVRLEGLDGLVALARAGTRVLRYVLAATVEVGVLAEPVREQTAHVLVHLGFVRELLAIARRVGELDRALAKTFADDRVHGTANLLGHELVGVHARFEVDPAVAEDAYEGSEHGVTLRHFHADTPMLLLCRS